jgi:hypothetical protein
VLSIETLTRLNKDGLYPNTLMYFQSLGTARQYTACVRVLLRRFRGLARRSPRYLPVYDLRGPRKPARSLLRADYLRPAPNECAPYPCDKMRLQSVGGDNCVRKYLVGNTFAQVT